MSTRKTDSFVDKCKDLLKCLQETSFLQRAAMVTILLSACSYAMMKTLYIPGRRSNPSLSRETPQSGKSRVSGPVLTVLSLAALLFLWPSLDSRKTFNSRSQPRVSYQHSSDFRSTSDIVTACLVTVIANSFLSLRPIYWDGYHQGQGSGWKSLTEKFIAWAALFVFPEFAVTYAYAEYQDVRDDYLFMARSCSRWTLRHSFFAKMNGFTVVRKKDTIPVSSGRQILEQGAKLDDDDCERLEREIEIKSYTDSLPSLIVNIQAFSFLLGVAAREFASLPLSPLEHISCSHLLCTFLVRVFWDKKPSFVHDKIIITIPSPSFFSRRKKRQNAFNGLFMFSEKSDARTYMMGICGAVIIAGGLLASWDVAFSSFSTRITLLFVGAATMALPIFSYVVFYSWADSYKSRQTLFAIIVTIYCLLRFGLISLVFSSFRSLPSDVYLSPSLRGHRFFLIK